MTTNRQNVKRAREVAEAAAFERGQEAATQLIYDRLKEAAKNNPTGTLADLIEHLESK
jgi:hypothetical protein